MLVIENLGNAEKYKERCRGKELMVSPPKSSAAGASPAHYLLFSSLSRNIITQGLFHVAMNSLSIPFLL